ncbi:MAG TPA: glycosyltransferase family 4 protein [Thermoleophilaceae bacterium]|nr:glycosyltransferase family 4 protein [Thermoleophilaceae bacterium]
MADRQIRLLIYTETYALGGDARFLVDLVRGLDPDRYSVSFAGNPNAEFDRWLQEKIPSLPPRHTVPIETLLRSQVLDLGRRLVGSRPAGAADVWNPPTPDAWVSPLYRRASRAAVRYRQAVTNYRRLRILFGRLRPDVLHINNGGYPGAESCRVAALANRAAASAAVVHYVHGYAAPVDWPPSLERALDSRVDRATNVWITGAEVGRRQLNEVRGIELDRIRTVPFGQELGSPDQASRESARAGFEIPDGVPVIAIVGGLAPYKGHRQLFDAVAKLKASGIQSRTLVAGTGPQEPSLRDRAERLGIAGDIAFLGWLDDVSAVLDASDVVVQPSENMDLSPYSVREAMAHGLPVVATAMGGIPELVVHEETGFLVPPSDPGALAQALQRILNDPGRAGEMGSRGRRRIVDHFSMDQMVRAMDSIYVESLDESRST